MTHALRPRSRRRAFAGAAGVAVAVLVVLAAGPASASTTAPGDQRSSVLSVEPATSVLDISIVGGDTYLQLQVEPGHEVVVLGYDKEPYLRVIADGTVQANDASPATYLNLDRYAQSAVPDRADSRLAPQWATIGHDGTVRWHDHRIHWMSPAISAAADAQGTIQDWTISLLVDGTPTTVNGRLTQLPTAAFAPFLAAVIVVAAGGVLLGRHRPAPAALGLTALGTAAATTSAVIEWLSLPADVARRAAVVLLPMLTSALMVLAIVAWRRRVDPPAEPGRPATHRGAVPAITGWATLLALGLLAGWLAVRGSGLWEPVLVTALDPRLERTLIAVTLGSSGAAAALLVWSDAVRLPTPSRRRPSRTPRSSSRT